MVARIFLQPVSGRNTRIITRRQSQPVSLQYDSKKPYSPSGRPGIFLTVTDLVSRAPSSGNFSTNGIIGMGLSPRNQVRLFRTSAAFPTTGARAYALNCDDVPTRGF